MEQRAGPKRNQKFKEGVLISQIRGEMTQKIIIHIHQQEDRTSESKGSQAKVKDNTVELSIFQMLFIALTISQGQPLGIRGRAQASQDPNIITRIHPY